MKFDAVIVGARCAGAATALLLARAGARVLLIDKGRYGSDSLSTHALMRGAVLLLHRWGVLPAIVAAGTPPVRSTTFSYRTEDVTLPVAPKFGIDALYAPRRALLDRTLVDAAVENGAAIHYGVCVDEVIVDPRGRVRGIVAAVDGARQRIDADLVIGADGRHSTIAARVGAATVAQGRHSAGVLYSYWEGVPVDGYYWAFQGGTSMGAIPTNDGATCVFVSLPSPRFRAEVHGRAAAAYRPMIREASAAFDARLDGARRVEPIRGFGGQVGFIKRSTGAGWALVGDAGYFKDPLTAHGITDALRDAELLVRAVISGTAEALTQYETTRHDLSQQLFEITDEIASFGWSDEGVQALHRELSTEMAREVRALAALTPLPRPLPSGHALQCV